MGEAVTLKLCRNENIPWGFRLTGGKDFGVLLTVQKVNPRSVAEQCGLKNGDAVLSIMGISVDNMRHKDAQDAIIRAGNYLEICVQREGAFIGPKIKPAGVPVNVNSVAETDGQQEDGPTPPARMINQNMSPKPYEAPAMGDKVTALVHNQYNSPAAMYSMNVIAETLSAHAEILSSGVKGINFMKPEKPINTASPVYQLVHEEDLGLVKDGPLSTLRYIEGPPVTPPLVTKFPTTIPRQYEPPSPLPQAPVAPPLPPPTSGQGGVCSDCARPITGMFVRIKDKNLHEECFRCSTCGTPLRNMGYININEKLYCEIHARQAAQMIAPGTDPVPVAPSTIVPPAPPHRTQGPSVSPGSSSTPTFIRNVSPIPFHLQQGSHEHRRVKSPTRPQGKIPVSPLVTAGQGKRLPFEKQPYMPAEPPRRIQGHKPASIVPQQQRPHSPQFRRGFVPNISDTRRSSPGASKFIWPPPSTPFHEAPVSPPVAPSYRAPPGTQHVNYSPLATKSTPANKGFTPMKSQYPLQPSPMSAPAIAPKPTYVPPPVQQPPPAPVPAPAPPPPPPPCTFITSIAPLREPMYCPAPAPLPEPIYSAPAFEPAAPSPPPFSVPSDPPITLPPLPSSFETAPPVCSEPPSVIQPFTPAPAPPAAPASVVPNVPGFSPSRAPVIEPSETKPPSTIQPGVPSGAGSRAAPRRGRGQLKQPELSAGSRIPVCAVCSSPIRGPFVTALGKTWCPDHFMCNNANCQCPLQDIGFVEEHGQLYCENCYEAFLAPICAKCGSRIKGDCLNAIDKQWHPDCFICAYCKKPFGNSSFYLEDALPYCEKDWNELFTTKCVGCGYPIEAGDRWVEALNNNYHSQCFKCSICNKSLEGQSFYAKGGRPFCKTHAR